MRGLVMTSADLEVEVNPKSNGAHEFKIFVPGHKPRPTETSINRLRCELVRRKVGIKYPDIKVVREVDDGKFILLSGDFPPAFSNRTHLRRRLIDTVTIAGNLDLEPALAAA